jgi:hypothetical protein
MPDAIHRYFGLSYANYLVVHRTLLQSMPDDWQDRFVDMLTDLATTFEHVDRGDAFHVTHGHVRYLTDLTPDEATALGYTIEISEGTTTYYDAAGNMIDERDAEVTHVLQPTPDPVPHYDRGRARIEPHLPTVSSGEMR